MGWEGKDERRPRETAQMLFTDTGKQPGPQRLHFTLFLPSSGAFPALGSRLSPGCLGEAPELHPAFLPWPRCAPCLPTPLFVPAPNKGPPFAPWSSALPSY